MLNSNNIYCLTKKGYSLEKQQIFGYKMITDKSCESMKIYFLTNMNNHSVILQSRILWNKKKSYISKNNISCYASVYFPSFKVQMSGLVFYGWSNPSSFFWSTLSSSKQAFYPFTRIGPLLSDLNLKVKIISYKICFFSVAHSYMNACTYDCKHNRLKFYLFCSLVQIHGNYRTAGKWASMGKKGNLVQHALLNHANSNF